MPLPSIKKIIYSALSHEEQTGALRATLEARLPRLQAQLLLPESEPVGALMAFVTNYIRSVPTSLRLVTAISQRRGFYPFAAPFLHMAQDYFLQPSDEAPAEGGLEALLDEAFLSHRLLEEVNDNHIRQLGRPLLPVDMTETNTIVHHLLGDTFATRLEALVQFTAAQRLGQEYVWARVRERDESPPMTATDRGIGEHRSVRLRLAS